MTSPSRRANSLPRSLSEDERSQILATVESLTLEQKASITAGRDMWATNAVPEAGIPAWRMTDGPNGARGTMFGPAGVRALCMPSGSALGATWDMDLVREVGGAIGREARARGARVLLAPTVNIQRSPLAGRTFECFSEDPLLAGRLAAVYVQGAQSEGVITTVKHFAGNEAEFERNSINSVIDERSLRELYLAPFEIAVKEGGALGIMTGYNRLNGSFCADSSWLLGDVLRKEWGFEGIVVSDWWALADTVQAGNAGLDIEMPGPGRAFGPALAAAIAKGDVAPRQLDRAVERLLTVMTRIDAREDQTDSPEDTLDDPQLVSLARRAAADAMVLIKNEGGLLPLSKSRIARLAVIGLNANRAQIMGGGSATLRAHHLTTPLAALRTALAGADIEVVYEQGSATGEDYTVLDATQLTTPGGEPGIEVAFYGGAELAGDPVAVHRGDSTEFLLMGQPAAGVPPDCFSLRASARFMAATGGLHRFRFATNSGARLLVDGEERANLGWDSSNRQRDHRHIDVEVAIKDGEPVALALELAGDAAHGFCQLSLKCMSPALADASGAAAKAAAQADVAIVVVGTSQTIESEGFDRTRLTLPRSEDELVRRVVAANPRTVVVVNSGSPVALPWLSDTPSVLQSWFGGQEMASALADVLFGIREPGGRTPMTFPVRIEHTPAFGNFPGEAGEVRYGEGVLVGYRWYEARQLPVSVPFGHGGGYTSFEWGEPSLSRERIAAGDAVTVGIEVKNTGDRPGSDVVQIYVAPPVGPLTRAPKELQGFVKVHLDPGCSRRVEIELDARRFAYWHPGDQDGAAIRRRLGATPFANRAETPTRAKGWAIEPGRYCIHVARSSAEVTASLPLWIEGRVEGMKP